MSIAPFCFFVDTEVQNILDSGASTLVQLALARRTPPAIMLCPSTSESLDRTLVFDVRCLVLV